MQLCLPICFCTETDFVQEQKRLAQQFNSTYRYIDDVQSPKNSKFSEYLYFIYPSELEIKEITESATSASYLDCFLYIHNGILSTRLYDFNILIVNFPFLSSNIPSAPAYGVYVSQLFLYARACSKYQDFVDRGKFLTTRLFTQGNLKPKLVTTRRKFYVRHHDLVNPYKVAVSRLTAIRFVTPIYPG